MIETPITARISRDASPPTVPRARNLGILASLTGILSLTIRLLLHGNSFDLFGDEVIYTKLGRSVASGGFPRFDGQLFFLHGPMFFYLEAGWQRLLGSQPGISGQIYEMRTLNALLAAITGAALALLAARAAGSLRAGAIAGLLFAADPFCIRQNDRVLLETSLMFWIFLGYLLLTPLIRQQLSPRAAIRAVCAGLLFGAAVLTKDEAALLTVLPLLAAAVLRWGPSRTLSLITAGTTVACYVTYAAVVAANGYFGTLWEAKTVGLRRMLGLLQTTGFHHSGTPSIYFLLFAQVRDFAVTYLVLALAVPALIVVMRRGEPLQRMLGLLYCSAAVTLAYAFTLGTLEEQELYLLAVPSLLVLPVAATLARRTSRGRSSHGIGTSRSTGWSAVTIVTITLALALDVTACLQWLTKPDDGYARLLSYMAARVPAGATVAAFDGTTEDGITQYALAGRYRVGRWVTPAARAAEHVRYAVVPWTEINQHYSYYSPARVLGIVHQGKVLFSFRGRTYGDVVLYQLSVPPTVEPAHKVVSSAASAASDR